MHVLEHCECCERVVPDPLDRVIDPEEGVTVCLRCAYPLVCAEVQSLRQPQAGVVSPDRWECPICEALIVPQHFKRHLTRHDGDGTPRERVDAAWLAFTDHQRGAVDPDAMDAAREAFRQARQELEHFGASEDFTRSPLEAAIGAYLAHPRGAVSAFELLATLEREAPDDDAPTAYRNGYDAALMTARMVVGSASDRPQGAVEGSLREHIYEQTHGDPPERKSLPGSDEKWNGYLLGVEEAARAAESWPGHQRGAA